MKANIELSRYSAGNFFLLLSLAILFSGLVVIHIYLFGYFRLTFGYKTACLMLSAILLVGLFVCATFYAFFRHKVGLKAGTGKAKADDDVKRLEDQIFYLGMEKEHAEQLIQKLLKGIALLQGEKDPAAFARIGKELQRLYDEYALQRKNTVHATLNFSTGNHLVTTLQNTYPDLTKQELHICSLLKMGLNTKEIANRLHNSIETIFDYRKSIRHKLGLSYHRDEKLEKFLSRI